MDIKFGINVGHVELQRAEPHHELAEQDALNHAATKIQSTYRGFVTRRELEGKYKLLNIHYIKSLNSNILNLFVVL